MSHGRWRRWLRACSLKPDASLKFFLHCGPKVPELQSPCLALGFHIMQNLWHDGFASSLVCKRHLRPAAPSSGRSPEITSQPITISDVHARHGTSIPAGCRRGHEARVATLRAGSQPPVACTHCKSSLRIECLQTGRCDAYAKGAGAVLRHCPCLCFCLGLRGCGLWCHGRSRGILKMGMKPGRCLEIATP